MRMKRGGGSLVNMRNDKKRKNNKNKTKLYKEGTFFHPIRHRDIGGGKRYEEE